MRTDVESGDWTDIDPWWSAHTQAWPIRSKSASVRLENSSRGADYWVDLDRWWRVSTETSPIARQSDPVWTVAPGHFTDSWEELDFWWDAYTDTGHETAVEIAQMLSLSNEKWKQSASPFDTDPLASVLTRDQGPLLPSNEEGWSDWLANLLRRSGALVTELFDLEVTQAPSAVVREDRLLKDSGGFRRPDILIFHGDQGISIEVKLNDENYGKTAETALLVERHYDKFEWTHVILLPEWKRERLEAIVEPSVESRVGGQLQVEWVEPGPIAVKFWQDVTLAIRALLVRGEYVDDQWSANAYLFCSAVEQQIMNFQPQPIIDRMADPTNVVDTMQPIAFAGVLREQHDYLKGGQNS